MATPANCPQGLRLALLLLVMVVVVVVGVTVSVGLSCDTQFESHLSNLQLVSLGKFLSFPGL